MAKPSFIAVVGSANVDLTTFHDVFPRPGETIFGRKFDLGFGGKGANQAVAARLCGANVGMVAKVGSDLFGPATIGNFESQGIDATYVRIAPGVSSGVAPIFVDPSGQNRIIVVKGANDTLTPEDVDAAAPLLRKADTIIMQFEIPLRTVCHTVKFAKANGIRSIVNPAPAQPVDYQEVGAADYFIPNESEAEAITGMPVHSIDEARNCAEFLLRQGIGRVVITLGERGSLAAGPDRIDLIPAFKVQAVDTTGAGDAFIGSLAVFLSEGLPAEEALPRASLYAALSTTKVGTQKSFSKRAEFDQEWRNRVGHL
ncbi:MAG: ribokinase [Acidobacteria bacterium]|nr:MAG: ribokinase [Acidobacteriota bacterium]PYU70931.1 MAG: ribokinase [Acidobacteriota bacterium]